MHMYLSPFIVHLKLSLSFLSAMLLLLLLLSHVSRSYKILYYVTENAICLSLWQPFELEKPRSPGEENQSPDRFE